MIRKKSKQKEAILRVVKGTHSHPTAEWVYEQVRKELPNISLGTVYRNLKTLTQEETVVELRAGTPERRFDGKTENHYHLWCEQCGRVFDLEESLNKMVDQKVTKETGFRVNYHRMEFYGLCQDCQRQPVIERLNTV